MHRTSSLVSLLVLIVAGCSGSVSGLGPIDANPADDAGPTGSSDSGVAHDATVPTDAAGRGDAPVTTTGPEASADGASSCVVDSDCPQGGLCGYVRADGCGATGTCLPPSTGPVCGAIEEDCACDGTVVNGGCTELPSGFVGKPFAHAGSCASVDASSDAPSTAPDAASTPPDAASAPPDAASTSPDTGAPDTGVADAAASCTQNSDCPRGKLCGYLESAGCSATGTCVDSNMGSTCNLFEPGCACDGSTISIACTLYPSGYASKPLASAGQCSAACTPACDMGKRCCPGGAIGTQTCVAPVNGACPALP